MFVKFIYLQSLRVRLEKTKDDTDYNFCTWIEEIVEKDFTAPGKDSLRTWFINGRKRVSSTS